ncbi:MAG: DUF1223 domain-containing protein [Burkholderiales bacterium]|nr:DUF1223 domain-containing protein [Burkholderiales bacterium]
MSMLHNLVAAALLLPQAMPGMAATCSAESGSTRVALLELYTSEGCDSCPSTDQWFSALPQRGYTPQRVLALAFHVDYWNYLGWKDPYAQARFSARQRDANRRNQARVVYTPQLLLDGADYRRSLQGDDLGRRMATGQAPGAQIRMNIDTDAGQPRLRARISTAANTAQAYVAIYENNLINDVAAGENRGKRLRHDFVVRELYGPFTVTAATPLDIAQSMRKERAWKAADLHVAVFVQDATTGAALQALNLPWCGAG